MKSTVMVDHIRVIQHMFKLPKQQRHAVPDIAFTHAVEDGMLKKINAKKNWSQFFYLEILEATKQKVHHICLACGEYLTRIP